MRPGPALLQIAGGAALAATMWTDYALGLWITRPPDWLYALEVAVLLGVPTETLRRVLVAVLTRQPPVPPPLPPPAKED